MYKKPTFIKNIVVFSAHFCSPNSAADATTSYQSQKTEKDVEHITKALERCPYPCGTVKKVEEQQSQKEKTKEKKEKNRNPKVWSHTHMSKE